VSPRIHHPVFARLFAVLMRLDDQAVHRDEMLEGLSGRVIEVGAGTGANFGHYPDTVTEVLAVEPEPYLRGLAVEAAAAAPVPVEVVDGIAHDLPVPDGWADAAVSSLVLCSFDEPVQALGEMRRAVRPGGELRFYEHVRSQHEGSARWQERIDVVWPHLFGNCHTSRDSAGSITEAGWAIEQERRLRIGPAGVPNPVAPHVLGRARNPAD